MFDLWKSIKLSLKIYIFKYVSNMIQFIILLTLSIFLYALILWKFQADCTMLYAIWVLCKLCFNIVNYHVVIHSTIFMKWHYYESILNILHLWPYMNGQEALHIQLFRVISRCHSNIGIACGVFQVIWIGPRLPWHQTFVAWLPQQYRIKLKCHSMSNDKSAKGLFLI